MTQECIDCHQLYDDKQIITFYCHGGQDFYCKTCYRELKNRLKDLNKAVGYLCKGLK